MSFIIGIFILIIPVLILEVLISTTFNLEEYMHWVLVELQWSLEFFGCPWEDDSICEHSLIQPVFKIVKSFFHGSEEFSVFNFTDPESISDRLWSLAELTIDVKLKVKNIRIKNTVISLEIGFLDDFQFIIEHFFGSMLRSSDR